MVTPVNTKLLVVTFFGQPYGISKTAKLKRVTTLENSQEFNYLFIHIPWRIQQH